MEIIFSLQLLMNKEGLLDPILDRVVDGRRWCVEQRCSKRSMVLIKRGPILIPVFSFFEPILSLAYSGIHLAHKPILVSRCKTLDITQIRQRWSLFLVLVMVLFEPQEVQVLRLLDDLALNLVLFLLLDLLHPHRVIGHGYIKMKNDE